MSKEEDGELLRHRQAMTELVRIIKAREREAENDKAASYQRDEGLYIRGKAIQRYSLELREFVRRHAPQDVARLLDRRVDGS